MQDIYIKFDTPSIKGSSNEDNHKDWIEILNYNHSFTQPTSPVRSTAGGGTVERANHGDFSFSKHADSASVELLKYSWSGTHFKTVTVECFRASDTGSDTAKVKYLVITMEEVVISNISLSAGAGDVPTENISLSYGTIQYEYTPQKNDDGTAGDN